MSEISLRSPAARRPARIRTGLLVRVFDALIAWQERARQRRHLSALDDHMLTDMGLSRSDVEQEVGKPFWRL